MIYVSFSYAMSTAGREGPWLSLHLTCSFISLIAAPKEAGQRCREGEAITLSSCCRGPQCGLVAGMTVMFLIGIVPRIMFNLPNQGTLRTVQPEGIISPSGTVIVHILPFCLKAFAI